jgi:nitrate reductase gamma subunit
MAESLSPLDVLLFLVVPYCALLVGVAGTIERYRRHAFSCSSHSSQFLENRRHFWGEMAFHYGIILVLVGHVVVVALPGRVLAMTGASPWMFAIEAIGMALGLLAAFGLIVLIVRRVFTTSLRRITSVMDWLVFALLLVQIAGGVGIAVAYPWGSGWFAAVLTPYLWSLATLQPDATVVAAMPLLIKVHVATAFAIVGLFPFTRLVHVVAVPNAYLWRRPQVVRWLRRPALLEKTHDAPRPAVRH